MIQSAWNQTAKIVAMDVHQHQFSRHRGILTLPHSGGEKKLLALFGNDSYRQDSRARQEVRTIRRRLRREGLGEAVGFGLTRDGYTWVLVVRPVPGSVPPKGWAKSLEQVLWDAWFEACGMPADERSKLLA